MNPVLNKVGASQTTNSTLTNLPHSRRNDPVPSFRNRKMTDAPKLVPTSELQQESAYTKELNSIAGYESNPIGMGDSDLLRPHNNPLARDIEIIRKLGSNHGRMQSDLASIENQQDSNIFKSLEPLERHKSLAPKTALTAEKVREPHVIMIDLDVNRQKDPKALQFNSP